MPADEITRTGRLLERMLEGDSVAERRLFEGQQGPLLRHAACHRSMAFLRRHCSEEDLVDEVYVRAFASGTLQRFEDTDRGGLAALLRKMLDRVMADACRRHGAAKRGANVRLVHHDSMDMANIPSPDPTPTCAARGRELLAFCRSHLDERAYRVWSLVELNGCSSVEAAQQLGTTAAAVRSLLRRTKLKLTRLLADDGSHP